MAANRVFMVGSAGTAVIRSNGVPNAGSLGNFDLRAVVAWDEVAIAAGIGGAAYVYAEGHWTPSVSSTSLPITGLAGTAANDVFATGVAGLLLRYNGVQWSRVRSPNNDDIAAVAMDGRHVVTLTDDSLRMLFRLTRWTD